LLQYATIPCLSPAFDASWEANGHIDTAINLLAEWVNSRNLDGAQVRIQRLPGRTPVLVLDVAATKEDLGTVVLYGHMDKQPPLGEWSEGLNPYQPVRRGDRVYARGIADDGYATFAAVLAIEELQVRSASHARIILLIEASEESGSPDLEAHLDELADALGRVDLMICLDSGALTYDRLWITTSLRGLVNVEITVQVLEQGQHSGSASGVVPSSFRILRQLIDRVEDPVSGEILLSALHAIIPAEHLAAAYQVANEFGDVAGTPMPIVGGLDLMGSNNAERLLNRTWRPSLSITGMAGIPTPGEAGNVLRPFTTAVLSLRLPPTVSSSTAATALRQVLTTNVPSNARVGVEISGADGWLTPKPHEWLSDAISLASQEFFGNPVGHTGEGGSIPFLASLGQRYPDVQFVATGVLGPHSNAHGIDEMLDLPTTVKVTNCIVAVIVAHATDKRKS
jgi:acetylornithine deacetylase/succinyl-diaminopimelate desuccinylase-like protein